MKNFDLDKVCMCVWVCMCPLVLSILQFCINVASGHDTFSNYYSVISHRLYTHSKDCAVARTFGLLIVGEYVPSTVCLIAIRGFGKQCNSFGLR